MSLLAIVVGAFAAVAPALSASVDEEAPLTNIESVIADVEGAFMRWATLHQKAYLSEPAELDRRRGIFHSNALFVQQHNSESTSSQLALNAFADMTFEEFSGKYLGYDASLAPEKPVNKARLQGFRHAGKEAPDAVDWVAKGAVTPIKNQGQCGSCWAFSTTGSVEGINFLETGHLVSLSEQELVDCDKRHDNGCGGGLMDFAFEYIVENGGLDTEQDYAYWGALPSFCNHLKATDRTVVDITGFEDVPANDEASLAKAVAAQPVSIAVAVTPALQFYSSGVFDGNCGTALNHGVLAVGYGDDAEGGKFWKIKNSWGEGWGERGFFRLKKDVGGPGQCGLAMKASYPTKDDNDKPVPTICNPQWISFLEKECPVEQPRCQCEFNLLGLLCLSYSCHEK